MKKKLIKYLIWINLFAFSSCKLDGLQTNPNLLTPDQASIDYLLNSAEIEFGTNFFFQATYNTMDLTRLKAMINGADYNNSYVPASFDGVWASFYSTMLPDLNTVIGIGSKTGQTVHTGIARTLKAYTLITMVDLFGDIPWSQAENPSNFNPKTDPGSALYDTALATLNRALTDFGKTATGGYSSDLFYGGSTTKWKTFVKTLQLRLYLQKRLVDANAHSEIQAIVTAGDYIQSSAQDFVFPYFGNSITNPDTRHPSFVNNYLNGASDYMSNSLMVEMFDYNNKGLGIQDPRIRYYFYRQQDTPGTDVNAIACVGLPPPAHYPAGTAWCQGPGGYWGRDHLNNDGIGPDTKSRAVWGVFPAGGKFDADQGVPTTITDGNKGNGIWPILTSYSVNFMLAEDALVNGDPTSAGTYLQTGVTQSISKVMNFANVGASKVPTASAVTNYINQVMTDYNAAGADQMQVIQKENWKALFGNGLDMYNTYRRTGHPTDMQPARNPTPGDYYRALIYPAAYITRNANAKQHADNTQVFWDTNPADPWIF
ncbi:MAG TPA: SusD/RagB family nutrient-binding outer membrane lipoprotein [Cyclobacteriaceae bacterium]|nr:SusD/RagB family nutrient-binding outer membrane lipoprotein [Cyclobacteriaceae bacterium]